MTLFDDQNEIITSAVTGEDGRAQLKWAPVESARYSVDFDCLGYFSVTVNITKLEDTLVPQYMQPGHFNTI